MSNKDRAGELTLTAHAILKQVLKSWDLDCHVAVIAYDGDNVGACCSGSPDSLSQTIVYLADGLRGKPVIGPKA